MNLLLDTHLLIWAASTPERLSSEALSLLQNANYQLYFSAVNLWEITIKRRLGRQDFPVEPSLLRRGLIGMATQNWPLRAFTALLLSSYL